MDEEALAQDEAGVIGVALELDGDLRAPGHYLEALPGAQVLANHVGHEVMAVEHGHNVVVPNVQTVEQRDKAVK